MHALPPIVPVHLRAAKVFAPRRSIASLSRFPCVHRNYLARFRYFKSLFRVRDLVLGCGDDRPSVSPELERNRRSLSRIIVNSLLGC